MSVDAVFWRTLRQDFESLQAYKFSLIWNSRLQRGLVGTTLGESHWSWSDFPDESLRARLSAMALRGALALGYGSEDAWYDQLREAEFVRFKAAGELTQKQADGTFLDSEFGPIRDVVKESITLCYKLEADAAAEAPTAGSEQRPIVPSWQDVKPDSPLSNFKLNDWQDLQIRFLSDERIHLNVGESSETRNYAEFGFEDGRTKKPNLAWVTLRAMAQKEGIIQQAVSGQDWSSVEKRIQEIRRILRKL